MTRDSSADLDKRVTWAELFFDLVFVVAVTRVATLVEERHDALGLARALVVFVPLYWTWVGTAVLTNQQDPDRPVVRLRLFAIALAGVFMALAVGHAYEGTGTLLATAYWLGRIVLAGPLLGQLLRRRRMTLNPYLVSALLTGPLLIVGSLFDQTERLAVWAVAALLDLSAPTLLRRRMGGMHFDAAHLSERFGLFVLIALGESVAAIGASLDLEDVEPLLALTIAAAFAVACGLWWVYFHFAADAVRHSLATARVQLDITRLVLSYGHLVFIASIVVVAVGFREAIIRSDESLGWPAAVLVFGGCAAYLATFGFTRWAMFRLVSRTRLTAAAGTMVLLPVGRLLPPYAALVLVALVLVLLNWWEYTTNARSGFRARLVRRWAR